MPLKAKKVIRLSSPDQSHEVHSSQPFRSTSPPLPAVLKRMKEEGYSEEQPSVQTSHETLSSIQTSSNQITNHGSLDSLQFENQRKVNNHSRQSNKSAKSRKETMISFEDDNTEILAQLQAIQRVFKDWHGYINLLIGIAK